MRITVRSCDPRRARALQDALGASGVEAVAIVGPAASRGRMPEDVVVIDGAPDLADWANGETRRLRTLASPPQAIVAASHTSPSAPFAATFDGHVQLGGPEGLVAADLVRARRHARARLELFLRQETARDIGVQTPDPRPARGWRVLYIGEPSPFYLAQERALSRVGGGLEAAFSSFAGFDFLHDERFDAVTLNACADSATALALCGALRRNARLNHLPTAMIVRPDDTATVAGAVERGAMVIARAGCPPDAPIDWLFARMSEARRHAKTEAGLTAIRLAAATKGDLFSAPFFSRHLTRLASVAQTHARPLSLVALRVASATGARRPPIRAWERAVTEICSLATRLVRAEDTAALVDDDLIVAALPDAGVREGRRMAERVAGVVECTSFASRVEDIGPIVLAQSVVELAPGESGEGLLARAIDPLRLESVPA